MSHPTFYTVMLVLVVVLGACREAAVVDEPEAVSSNETLQQLYALDQQDRVGWEQLSEEQHQDVFARDRLRRKEVDDVLTAGEAHTAEDYYHAAMVYQHGDDSTHFRKAHEAARQALVLDATHASA